jgi:MSHA biogenesis protein MshM
LRVLYRASRGIPRLANILCHKALLAAFGPGHARVGRSHALAAVTDTDSTTLPLPAKAWLIAQENLGLVCLALVLSLGVAYVLSGGFVAWPGIAP